jgi:hypothetical protein
MLILFQIGLLSKGDTQMFLSVENFLCSLVEHKHIVPLWELSKSWIGHFLQILISSMEIGSVCSK